MEDKLEVNRIKSLYQEDAILQNIEKKYNKLLKLQVVPYINCIVNQYYLTIIGGDHYTKGLISQCKNYIEKLDTHLKILKNFKNSDDITNFIKNKRESAKKLETKMKKKYEEYINKSNQEEFSIKFKILDFHYLQLETNSLTNKKKDNKDHLDILKNEKIRINTFIENEKDEIFQKLLESQLGVIEQQIDLLK